MDEQARRERNRRIVARHAAVKTLTEALLDRLQPHEHDGLQNDIAVGESGMASDLLCAILVMDQVPVTPAERDTIGDMLDMWAFLNPDNPDHVVDYSFLLDRDGTVAHLNVIPDDPGSLPTAIAANQQLIRDRIATTDRLITRLADRLPPDDLPQLRWSVDQSSTWTPAEKICGHLTEQHIEISPAELDIVVAVLQLHTGPSPTNPRLSRRFPHLLDPHGTLARLNVKP